MYKLKITLKQHTPLIHFQHEQDGATLRASEVKPKLDKFLKEILEDDKQIQKEIIEFCREKKPNTTLEDINGYIFYVYNKILKEKAWMNEDTKSFNYKLRIDTNESDRRNIMITPTQKDGKYEADFPFLLSNLGGKESESELVNLVFYDSITLVFSAKEEKLLKKIDKYLDCFLAITNFGNRQSKGFGSFYRIDRGFNDFIKTLQSIYGDVYKKRIVLNDNSYKKYTFNYFKEFFKRIDSDYKKMKSGLNKKESLLQEYLPNYVSEKVAIKNKIKGRGFPSNTYYLRVLLGLAENMAYTQNGLLVKIEHLPIGDTDEECRLNKIDRFQSPLTFKIFEDTVFILPEETYEDILGQKFKFSIENDQTGENIITPFELNSIGAFNLNKFLDMEMKNLNWFKIKENNK